MASYKYKKKNIDTFLSDIYSKGLKRSTILSDYDIKNMITEIGIFKIKGYIYAFKNDFKKYCIDDIFIIYFFDKYLTKYIMDLTSSIESKLKSSIVELCYSRAKNPFFYLIAKNHKNSSFYINKETLKNWKYLSSSSTSSESYFHYGLYYRQKYDFTSNEKRYLYGEKLISIDKTKYNFPPFHYLIESATLGSVIHFIKSLEINSFDIFNNVSKYFGITNTPIFEAYLERLNEIRNRAAHRERLFNRSYRTVKGIGYYTKMRNSVNEHRMIDVILFLYFILNRLDIYTNYFDFEQKVLENLFYNFFHDSELNIESKNLISDIDSKNMVNIKIFILNAMK